MLPLVGITTSYDGDANTLSLNLNYMDAVQRAGGTPVAVAPIKDRKILQDLVHRLDGIIFSGGPDVDPSHYGEEPHEKLGRVCAMRDFTELYLAREMFRANKPILGICRGLQVVNVALGGTLYQDIPSFIKTSIEHSQDAPRDQTSHSIKICTSSRLRDILGNNRVSVNSFHHQSAKDIAKDLKLVAVSEDGVVEALEGRDSENFVLLLQWHPEAMIDKHPAHLRIFQEFVAAL